MKRLAGMQSSAQLHKGKLHEANPIVFFDVEMRQTPIGRIVMELYAHLVPRTAENFRQFCTGSRSVVLVCMAYCVP
jgi:peptidyl-prolyl isomerase H (cyclophilin H)